MVEINAGDYGAINAGDAPNNAANAVRGMVEKARGAVVATYPGETRSGLSQGTVAAVAYAGWIIGAAVVFFYETENPYARFHAAQSFVVWATLWFAASVCHLASFATFGLFGLWGLVMTGIMLVTFVAWVYLTITAYRGGSRDEAYRVPYIADFADKLAS